MESSGEDKEAAPSAHRRVIRGPCQHHGRTQSPLVSSLLRPELRAGATLPLPVGPSAGLCAIPAMFHFDFWWP